MNYLSRSRICRVNNGEFLVWSIGVLMGFLDKCEACNEKVIENEFSNGMNEEIDILNASDFKEKAPPRRQTAKKPSTSKCSDCDDCNHLLNQAFHCLFGYKTKTNAKYLETHSSTSSASRITYTLANSVNMYNHFKPDKLPEYDDLVKFSIPIEFYDFLREIIKLANPEEGVENADEETSALFDTFREDFQQQEIKDIDSLLDKLKSLVSVPDESQRDIYYLLADFNFKNQKPASLASGYFIKDLIINDNRFDSWTALALITSSDLLEDYLEEGIHLKHLPDADKFISMAHFSINLFKKSIELGSNDSKILVEYGSFLYQIHSYCSREIKYNEQVKHFADPALKDILATSKLEFLNLAYDAYLNAMKCSKKEEHGAKISSANPSGQDEGSSSVSSLTDKSNVDQPSQKVKKSSKSKSSEDGQEENGTMDDNENEDESDDELWLYHYMLGKIKEKFPSCDLMECLQHYQQVN